MKTLKSKIMVLGALFALIGSQSSFAETEKSAEEATPSLGTAREKAVRLQIFLDRAEFAPGKIDGQTGEFTRKALELYRESLGETDNKASGKDDFSDLDLASVDPLFITYTVTEADVADIGEVAEGVEEQAKTSSMPYESVIEVIAEKFHSSVDFISTLNPKTDEFKVGDKITVPNVVPFEIAEVQGLKTGTTSGASHAEPKDKTDAQEKTPDSTKDGSKDKSDVQDKTSAAKKDGSKDKTDAAEKTTNVTAAKDKADAEEKTTNVTAAKDKADAEEKTTNVTAAKEKADAEEKTTNVTATKDKADAEEKTTNVTAAKEKTDAEKKTTNATKDTKDETDAQEKSINSAELAVLIDTETNMATVREHGKIVAAYPVTLGTALNESPVGDWKITGVAKMPTFRYDKSMLESGVRSEEFSMIPPGPNNPVGVVWIALNKEGIGIHGTNDPDSIGRSGSHGCLRMANWDVVRFAQRIKTGVPVHIQ